MLSDSELSASACAAKGKYSAVHGMGELFTSKPWDEVRFGRTPPNKLARVNHLAMLKNGNATVLAGCACRFCDTASCRATAPST